MNNLNCKKIGFWIGFLLVLIFSVSSGEVYRTSAKIINFIFLSIMYIISVAIISYVFKDIRKTGFKVIIIIGIIIMVYLRCVTSIQIYELNGNYSKFVINCGLDVLEVLVDMLIFKLIFVFINWLIKGKKIS